MYHSIVNIAYELLALLEIIFSDSVSVTVEVNNFLA